jgi:acetyl esterase/lipase
MEPLASFLARHGFVGVTMSYRLAPQFPFPAQVHDCQAVLEWMRQNANRLELDPSRIALGGFSAGAHLALLTAYLEHSDRFRHVLNPNLARPDIGAVFSFAGPTDLTVYDGPTVRDFLGGPRQERFTVFESASPLSSVSRFVPPTFIVHGTLDSLVEPEQSLRLYRALEDARGEVTLRRPWLGHTGLYLFERVYWRELSRFLQAKLALRVRAEADNRKQPADLAGADLAGIVTNHAR